MSALSGNQVSHHDGFKGFGSGSDNMSNILMSDAAGYSINLALGYGVTYTEFAFHSGKCAGVC